MNNEIKKQRMDAIKASLKNANQSKYLEVGKVLYQEKNKLAPFRLNQLISEPPTANGDTAPIVVTGDKDEHSYNQFETIAYFNCLNLQPFARTIHNELDRFERKLKYRR